MCTSSSYSFSPQYVKPAQLYTSKDNIMTEYTGLMLPILNCTKAREMMPAMLKVFGLSKGYTSARKEELVSLSDYYNKFSA